MNPYQNLSLTQLYQTQDQLMNQLEKWQTMTDNAAKKLQVVAINKKLDKLQDAINQKYLVKRSQSHANAS